MFRTGYRNAFKEGYIFILGATFFLRVNGVPVLAKGSNWIPLDSFPDRVSSERIERLVDSVVAANMNLLRVWGGGFYEVDHFYSLADRRGLLIWQDFMFANSLYPATPEFLDSVATEARQQVSLYMVNDGLWFSLLFKLNQLLRTTLVFLSLVIFFVMFPFIRTFVNAIITLICMVDSNYRYRLGHSYLIL